MSAVFALARLKVLSGQIVFLQTMLEAEIARNGETESFLIRAGLLQEILQLAASAIEARSDATGTGAAVGESAAPSGETPND